MGRKSIAGVRQVVREARQKNRKKIPTAAGI